ncbi:hypothetical protein K493DRAFT_316582 [Basidiobolus meristosporus CBS 931.73]|uniref:Uncharacterized protein n=1 Tax=Basidiobolus meristosporus CBS 931.73 TaxID=1314790 RepID=A0A1Y1Y378_9FUNG|nr:hypothetical protein K493DRAFT_316582 [Basidiobolus meristosporus CBS 931.73]|eukprot:ORX92453.1 hypothetical protein K493DRAFT_316582 [Basidiobolus meristosporus CBS 931.73]
MADHEGSPPNAPMLSVPARQEKESGATGDIRPKSPGPGAWPVLTRAGTRVGRIKDVLFSLIVLV